MSLMRFYPNAYIFVYDLRLPLQIYINPILIYLSPPYHHNKFKRIENSSVKINSLQLKSLCMTNSIQLKNNQTRNCNFNEETKHICLLRFQLLVSKLARIAIKVVLTTWSFRVMMHKWHACYCDHDDDICEDVQNISFWLTLPNLL